VLKEKKEGQRMLEKTNLLGAAIAHVVYVSSLLVFASRLLGRVLWEQWAGYLLLLTAFPLGYLLRTAPQLERPALYYIQVGLMIVTILVIFLLDYALKIEFRQTRWMVIGFVMLYFAGTGGMLGVAAEAGRAWTISAVILYLVMAALAFWQRAVTGL
jgi:hypothetical protein